MFAGGEILEAGGAPRRSIHNLSRREFMSESNQLIMIRDTMAVGGEIFHERATLDKNGTQNLLKARRNSLMTIGDTRGSFLAFWVIQGRAVIRNSCADHARLTDDMHCAIRSCREIGGCARFGNRIENHTNNRYVTWILLVNCQIVILKMAFIGCF